MANTSPHEALRQEILAQAERQRTELLRSAEQKARTIETEARATAQRTREGLLHGASVELERRRQRALAAVPIEARRLEHARIASLLGSIRQEIRSKLAVGPGVRLRESIASLCAQAIRGMTADSYVVRVSPEVHRAVEAVFQGDLRDALGKEPTQVTLTLEPGMAGYGVVVESGDGCWVWDNRLEARLERLWPELELQVAIEAGLVTGELGGQP